MTSTHHHLDRPDDRSPAGPAHRSSAPAPARPLAGRDDPRLVHAAGADILQLQRAAGNAAVTTLVAPVQRAVTIDEITTEVAPPGPGDDGGAVTPGPVTSDGATTTITGGAIRLDAAMTSTDGVIRAGTIIADNVVGSNYTPGAGNMW
jgi:hypothetical protein